MGNQNIRNYAEIQYNTPNLLNDRINLWEFGLNPQSLTKWIFSHLKLKEHEQILELGCGTGKLWADNYTQVPNTCKIVLSDFSERMLDNARMNLKGIDLNIKFENINAEKIPYPEHTFDLIVACHMLYHVPDLSKALAEISRALKPNGRFISTTVSVQHLAELNSFLSRFNLHRRDRQKDFNEFYLEKGKEILEPYFSNIKCYEYVNPVEIYEVTPLLTYIKSMFPKEKYPDFQLKEADIQNAIQSIIDTDKKFTITGISGLFRAGK